MNKYQQFTERKQREYSEKFDPSELAPQFVPHYNTGQRVIILTKYGETKRGYIGVTTGWKPCFLLMNNTRSIGSSETLSAADQIIGTVNKYR
jgi:hypothetical protein